MPFNPRLVFAILISLGLAIFVEHRVFVDTYAINDDVRNQIYWMGRFIDPQFFQADYVAAYFTQPSMISPIVGAIYKLFSYVADPKLLTQYLPFLIITVTTYFLYKASEIHAGAKYAFWVCLTFNSYIWMMKYTAGGLARAFFYLLFFLFFWMLAKRAWTWIIVTIALQAIIYPTACFLSLITLVVESLRGASGDEAIQKRNKDSSLDCRALPGLAITRNLALLYSFIASAIILYFRYIFAKVPGFGPMTTLEQALKMPEFYLDGRACVFVWPFSFTETGIDYAMISRAFIDFFDKAWILLALVFILVILALIFKKTLGNSARLPASPHYLWTSSIASLSLFVIAYLSLFYLYLPHRYIAYTLPLIPVYLIAALFYKIENSYPQQKAITWIITILFLFSTSALWREDLIHVGKGQRKLHQFLATTPKQSMIAAPLELSSNIPAFAYRSVLISRETNIPFHQAYYHQIKERQLDLAQLYKTENIDYINSFVKKHKIDYIVVDRKDTELNKASPLLSLTNEVYSNKRYRVLVW